MTDWIQQRSSLLNNTNNAKSATSVDKELARLKNMGAVSSVWTNKFVQEDTSGANRRQSYTRASTLAGSKKPDEDVSPVAHLQAQYDECQSLLDKANKDIEYYKSQVAEEAEKSKQLEESSKQEATTLWFQCETLKTQFAQTEARLKKAQAEIESYKLQLADQKDQHQKMLEEQNQTGQQEAASLWFQCETLKTDFAHMEARLKRANSEIENYKQQLQNQQGAFDTLNKDNADAGKDEAAALWFQCETLKTQNAHTEARLKSANAEIEAYKQQLEEQKETYQKALNALSDEKEQGPKDLEYVSKDEAASLWFQCETLKTEFAHIEARLKTANAEIEEYKQQLQDQKETYQQMLEAMKQETDQLLAKRQSTNNKEAAALWFQCETLKTEFAQTEARLKKANAEIESYKQQLHEQQTKHATEQDEKTRDIGTTDKDEDAVLWSQYEALKAEFAHTEAQLKKANADIELYKQQLEEQAKNQETDHAEKARDVESISKDEAAALWFQYETLKTEFAQTEARLKKANTEIESYKQQLEEHQNISATEHAEKIREIENSSKDEAAALWFQNEALKTEFAQTEARLKKANAEIESLKQLIEEQKVTHTKALAEHTEKTRLIENSGKDEAAALWFQCETLKTQFAQTEGRLKKAHIEIETHKEKEQIMTEEYETCVRQLAEIIVKQDVLLEQYEIKLSDIDVDLLNQELATIKKEKETMEHTIIFLRAELETSRSQMNLVFAVSTEIQNEFGVYKEQRDQRVQDMLDKKDRDHAAQRQVADQDLHAQIAQLKQALDARDKVIEDLKVQRDAQVMDLTQTILDKDARIMEMMNNSQQTPTESYFPSQDTPKLQMAKVREFMYSTSEDDDDSDVLMMSYSDEEPKNYFSHEDNFHEFADAVSSPVSSTISFDSSEDAKHFSYASAKSRPVSTTTESDFYKEVNQRLSNGRFDLLKDNWPIPPPTPPPNEPLPPVPRRGRSRTVGREESPNTSIYRTSIHQTNELPRIIPLQRD